MCRVWALWAFRNNLGKFLIASSIASGHKLNFQFSVYIFDVDEDLVWEKSIEITLYELTTLESIDQFDQTIFWNAHGYADYPGTLADPGPNT